MIQDIYIIDNTQSVLNVLKQIFKNDVDYQFSSVKTEELNFALKNIPDMIIIDEDTIDIDIVESLYMFCFQMYGLFICYLLIH